MQPRCICAHMRSCRSAGQSSGVVKWKLLKLSNTFPIDTPQAHNFMHLCVVYPFYHSLSLPYESLPLKVSFLEIFNQILLLILIGSRSDPDPISDKVLAFIWFLANKHFYDYFYRLIILLRTIATWERSLTTHYLEQSWILQYSSKPSEGTQRSEGRLLNLKNPLGM